MQRTAQTLIFVAFVTLVAGLSAAATGGSPWRVFTYQDGTFVPLADRPGTLPAAWPTDRGTCPLGDLPPDWHVLTTLHADITRDGQPECALLVWRPWQDWPIMRWSDTPSPIAANQDTQGHSAHIILIQPRGVRRLEGTEARPPSWINPRRPSYRELWAGSALAVPITHFAAGDVDGDGWNELVALEGDYTVGRYGPARHVAVWRWNGFGFTLKWRSPPDRFIALALTDLDGDNILEILVR